MRRGVARYTTRLPILAAAAAVALAVLTDGTDARAACFYHPPSPPPDAEARVRAFDFAGVLGEASANPDVADLVRRSTEGDANAQVELAHRFLVGNRVPRSYETALMLLYAAIARLTGPEQAAAACTAGGIEEYLVARDRLQATTPARRPR